MRLSVDRPASPGVTAPGTRGRRAPAPPPRRRAPPPRARRPTTRGPPARARSRPGQPVDEAAVAGRLERGRRGPRLGRQRVLLAVTALDQRLHHGARPEQVLDRGAQRAEVAPPPLARGHHRHRPRLLARDGGDRRGVAQAAGQHRGAGGVVLGPERERRPVGRRQHEPGARRDGAPGRWATATSAAVLRGDRPARRRGGRRRPAPRRPSVHTYGQHDRAPPDRDGHRGREPQHVDHHDRRRAGADVAQALDAPLEAHVPAALAADSLGGCRRSPVAAATHPRPASRRTTRPVMRS